MTKILLGHIYHLLHIATTLIPGLKYNNKLMLYISRYGSHNKIFPWYIFWYDDSASAAAAPALKHLSQEMAEIWTNISLELE